MSESFPRVLPHLAIIWLAAFMTACAPATPPPAEPRPDGSAPREAGEVADADTPSPAVPPEPESEPEAEPAEAEPEPEYCRRGEPFGPIVLTEEEAATRHGHGARTFADLSSSKRRPVEVCGPRGEVALLMQLTCADGSHPLTSVAQGMRARTGSMGPGGRCGKVVDLYQVTCPEKTYKVYMDMYLCAPGEQF